MTTLVTYGDRLVTAGGRESWLKRGSVPLGSFGQGAVALSGQGRVVSYQQLYEEQPWVAVAVNKLARQVARLPLYAHRLIEGTRWEGESEPLELDHPLARLLARPWPRAGELHLKQKAMFPALVHGNAALAMFREAPGGPPASLVPLDYRHLTAHCLGGDGEIDVWETGQSGRPRMLAREDVLHFAWEGGGGDLGVSPLKQLGTTLRTEDAAQRYQSSSFDNGARPSGALVLPQDARLDADERQELREEIRGQHAGVDQAFKVALLSGGMDWKPFGHTAVEAELIDQRKLNREEVAAVYDVPAPLIGILDHATYSNVAELHRMLYGMVLGPWLSLIEDTIKAQIIDPYEPWAQEGLFVAFDLSEVLKGDALKEIQAVREGIQTGVLTVNEGRRRLNMSRHDDPAADELLIPVNNLAPLGDAGSAEDDAPDGDDAPGDGPPRLPASDDETVLKHLERAGRVIASRKGAGHPEPFDRERFVRELGGDLNDRGRAEAVADLVEQASAAGGDDAGSSPVNVVFGEGAFQMGPVVMEVPKARTPDVHLQVEPAPLPPRQVTSRLTVLRDEDGVITGLESGDD